MANQKKPKKAQPKRLGSRPQARTAKALKRKAKPAPHVPYAARPAKAPVEEVRPDEIFKTRIPSEFEPARADKIIATLLDGVSRSRVQKALELGLVKVNGQTADCRTLLNPGDAIEVALPSPGEPTARPVKMALEVLFEDAHIIAVNKPAGLLTHPVQGSDEVSIVHGLLHYTKGKLAPAGGAPRPGVVHRLDRETSGILMLAKKRSALTALHEQIRLGQLDKRYLTLVKGDWQHRRQHIKLPLFKYTTPEGERRVRVQADGQPSHTVFNLLRKYGDYVLLEAELKTGRTHQIRVHLASSGFPIVGDDKYGDYALNRDLQKRDGQRSAFKRMFLHAYRLRITHPMTGESVDIEATLPKPCVDFLQSLEPKAVNATESA